VTTRAVFPSASLAAGMYESFYLRAIAPDQPLGVWIRYTVHKPPGAAPAGSLWFTAFDPRRGRPVQQKLTTPELGVPAGGWIAIDGAAIGETHAEGRCYGAGWSLQISQSEPELRHIAPALLYRLPLPRTKLSSPAPLAAFSGSVEIPQGHTLAVDGWQGMVGHNWGSEHAERWIWIHGVGFAGHPGAWLDLALGRIEVAGRLTPWVANGALSIDGRRLRLGGLLARHTSVSEQPGRCALSLRGASGLRLECVVEAPPNGLAGWRYADPDGGEHDVVNCSVARLSLTVRLPGGAGPVSLETEHGGAYELGMRERDHGVALAPFPDG
jgi:hypothetical protein